MRIPVITLASQFKTLTSWATRVEIAGFVLTAALFSRSTMSVPEAIIWVGLIGAATVSGSFLIRRSLKCPRCDYSLAGTEDLRIGRCSQCRLGFHRPQSAA